MPTLSISPVHLFWMNSVSDFENNPVFKDGHLKRFQLAETIELDQTALAFFFRHPNPQKPKRRN